MGLMGCIAQSPVGVTFTESGKGAGIYSGLVDKTATAAPATVSSIANTIGTAVTVLEFTIRENGSRDGYPLQIKELRFYNIGTSDTADLRFILEGPGSNNTVGRSEGNKIYFSDFGDLIVNDGDTTGKTYQLRVHVRSNIQGSTEDNQTIIIKTSPTTDFDVVEASSNILQSVSTFQQNPSTAVSIAATELQGKNSFTGLTGLINQDITGTGSISVYATDANGRIDRDFTGNVTISAHQTICPNAAPGNLTSTDTLVRPSVLGISTWTDLRYDTAATIRIRAQAGGVSDLCSAQITFN